MRKIFVLLGVLCHYYTYAQLQESFSDGDFTQNPAWVGNVNSFTVNAAGQLQTNGPAVTNSDLQLATPCSAVTGTTWEFWARLNLATSGGNYADIYLMSDSVNLKGSNSGYFVRIGGTPDEVSLFRKDKGSNPVYVINGRDASVAANTANVVRVRVNRDVASRWTLWLDPTGTGQNFTNEGSAVDATYQQSAFFGVQVRYSAANNRNFLFDDFSVIDNTSPQLQSVEVLNNLTLAVLFNEPVSAARAQQVSNYNLTGVGVPATASRQATNPALVHLTFNQPIAAGSYQLTVNNIEDLFGNRVPAPLSLNFTYVPPVAVNYREVRINEVLADFSPEVNLPAAEFIELYNSSQKTINLQGWQYTDATNVRGTLPPHTFTPGSYVILCRAADSALFRPYGPVLGLSTFPALNDSGDEVNLYDNTGKRIDKITYTTAWYQNSTKASGGWSIELINPLAPCREAANWVASRDPSGGTPGRQNSVYDLSPDTQPPTIIRAEVINPTTIKLIFSETLDSLAARNLAHYSLSENLRVSAVSIAAPHYQEVLLTLNNRLETSKPYTLTVQQVRDCAGNALNPVATVTIALPEAAITGNIVINEVLFNPRSGGVDFVELVNRSGKYIDLKNWQLGNLRPDSAADFSTITSETFVMAPQQYLVLTTRPDIIQTHYPAANANTFLRMSRLPAYPDDNGTVQVLDANHRVIDRMTYQATMHFPLLTDVNGVSLERIRLQGDSSTANWHSAASSVGYATPGYKNSQYLAQSPSNDLFTIEPALFTPDDDGDKDFTTISYHTGASGYVTNITVYNANGREIKRLVKNQLLGQNGLFRWDGLDERGRKVPVGYYVLYIEIFNLQGQVKAFKETVVVGTRF